MKPGTRFVFYLCLLVASGVMIFGAINTMMTTIGLKKDINNLETEIDTLTNQEESLSKQKENLKDQKYIENYARGKYKVTKEGEKVYKLPSKEDQQEANK